MNKNFASNRGITHILIIIVGILISAVLIGLFTYKGKGLFPHAAQPASTSSTAPSAPVYPNIPSINQTYPNPGCGIAVTSPVSGQIVGNGFQVTGAESGCGWAAFEAQAGTVQAYLQNGAQLGGPVPLAVSGDWMKLPVVFAANISITQPVSSGADGFLLFRNEDPSGGNPQFFKVSVKF